MGKTLEQVAQKATAATEQLDGLVKRVEGLEERARSFGEIDARIESLLGRRQPGAARRGEDHGSRRRAAEASTVGAAAVVAALETQASIDALRRETHDARGVPDAAPASRDRDQAVGRACRVTARRSGPGTSHRGQKLEKEYAKLRDISRESKEDSQAASEAVKDVESASDRCFSSRS